MNNQTDIHLLRKIQEEHLVKKIAYSPIICNLETGQYGIISKKYKWVANYLMVYIYEIERWFIVANINEPHVIYCKIYGLPKQGLHYKKHFARILTNLNSKYPEGSEFKNIKGNKIRTSNSKFKPGQYYGDKLSINVDLICQNGRLINRQLQFLTPLNEKELFLKIIKRYSVDA